MRNVDPSIRHALIALALAALVLAVYWPAAHYPFIDGWDDELYVSRNSVVQRGITSEGVGWAFTTFHAANWHPLTWLSHMADVDLFGLDAGWHHRVNLFLHALNAALLFFLLRSLTGAPWRSGFVAALFAVHPLHVESVAWVAERKDLLCALFFLLALGAYARYARTRARGRYALAALLFALGLLSKPMIVTLPFVLLLLDWWPLGRFGEEPGKGKARAKPDPRGTAWRLAKEKVPLLALALGSVVATLVAQGRGGAVASLGAIPFVDRLANAAVSYLGYAAKTVWPSSLSYFYPHPVYLGKAIPLWQSLGAGAVLAAVTGLAILRARRNPWFTVGWLWFLGMLVPVIGLVQIGQQAMADRYTYLPDIGLFVAVTWGLADLAKGWRFRETVGAALAVAAIAGYSVAAHREVGFWRSGTALYERALAVSPDNYLAHFHIGTLLERQGRFEDAASRYRQSLRIDPTFPLAHNNLGLMLEREGRVDEALAEFREAVRISPAYANSRVNLADLLLRRREIDEAVAQYREALRLDPRNAKAHNNLGIALINEGKVEEATGHFRDAVRLDPNYEMARRNLERALLIRSGPGQ